MENWYFQDARGMPQDKLPEEPYALHLTLTKKTGKWMAKASKKGCLKSRLIASNRRN